MIRRGETTAAVAAQVAAARALQQERSGPASPAPINAAMTAAHLRRFCALDLAGRALLDRAFEASPPAPSTVS